MTGVIVDAFADRKRTQILADTWGGPPAPGGYPGQMLFTVGESGDIVIIRHEFTGIEDGPFFWQERNDYISDLVIERDLKKEAVYRWTGTYTRFKNGRCRFSGRIKTIEI